MTTANIILWYLSLGALFVAVDLYRFLPGWYDGLKDRDDVPEIPEEMFKALLPIAILIVFVIAVPVWPLMLVRALKRKTK